MNNQLSTARPMSLSAAFATPKFQSTIHNALNDAAHEKQFIASVVSACAINPVLQSCTPASILSAALLGESLKLSPSPQLGQYYMVPYDETLKDENGRAIPLLDETGKQIVSNGYKQWKKVKRAQFQMGYKGFVQLALRSGQYRKLNVMSVKVGELIHWDALNEDISLKMMEDEESRENAPTVGYYAMFEYLNGFKKAMYWSRDKMERHALRYSKGYAAKKGYTFWEKDFDAMAYKTMLRQLISKWGIMTIDLQTAFEKDVVAEVDEAGVLTVNADDQQIPDAADTAFQDVQDMEPSAPAAMESDSTDEQGELSMDEL